MAKRQGQIELSGPLFERDVRKTIGENIRDMLEGVAREGEGAIRGSYPSVTGAGRAGVKGRVASLSGKPWFLTAVISQTHVYPWRVHKSVAAGAEYRGGKTEARVRVFKRTASALRRARAVAVADLTKGLN